MIERVVETVRTVVESGISAAYLDQRLAAVQQSLQSQIAAVAASSHDESQTIYQTMGMVARIENLDDVNITNSRWTGGSISGATISGTISAAIDTVTATISNLTTTNSTTTKLSVTGTASTSALVVSGLNAANCDVKASSAGVLSCGTDASGAFGQAWEVTNGSYLAPTTTLGVIVSASSTVGGGTQTTGLTISGGATTTGNAHVAGNIAVGDELHLPNTGINIRGLVGGSVFLGLASDGGIRNSQGLGWDFAGSTGSDGRIITTGGNLGIGTTSPYAKLSVTNTGSGPSFVVEDDTSPDSTPFIVDANGNVGVGTTSPYARLSAVIGSGSGTGLAIVDAAGQSAPVFSYERVDGLKMIEMKRSSNSLSGVLSLFSSGAGETKLYGDSALLIDTGQTAQFRLLPSGNDIYFQNTQSSGSMYFTGNGSADLTGSTLFKTTGDVLFGVAAGSASGANVAFKSTGNLGIGTTTPWATLSVHAAAGAYPFAVGSSSATQFLIGKEGDVGVGTATLNTDNLSGYRTLTISDTINAGVNLSGGTTELQLYADNSFGNTAVIRTSPSAQVPLSFATNDTERLRITGTGNLGIGTTSPYAKLSVVGPVVAEYFHATSTTATSTLAGGALLATGGGNVGIGTTSPWRKLSVDGTVSLKNMTAAQAGSVLCLSADNEVTTDSSPASPCSSSLLANKKNIADLSAGLDAVMRLRPVEFDWKDGFGRGHDLGFIAEEVQGSVPILADYELDGSLSSVKYTQVGALLTKAIQELASITGTFKANLITWLADAANGITKFFAGEVHTDKLCIGSTCVTEDQFIAVFGDQSAAAAAANTQTHATSGGSSAAGNPNADSTTTTTPSVIEPTTSASSTPDIVDPEAQPPSATANDNEQASGDSERTAADEQAPTHERSDDQTQIIAEESAAEPPPVVADEPQAPAEPLDPQPANDNTSPPPAELIPTGTE